MKKLLLALFCITTLSACIAPKSYVDTALGNTDLSASPKAKELQPYQLVFEFKTKGSPNARATGVVKPMVAEQIAKSGMLGTQSDVPVARGRQLIITIDNVVLTDSAAAKGFGVGLTFGLVGTMVTDGYVAQARYSSDGKPVVTADAKHALHTTIGNASGPAGVAAMAPIDAIRIVVQQITQRLLQGLAPGIAAE
jgi:hypothetical protein